MRLSSIDLHLAAGHSTGPMKVQQRTSYRFIKARNQTSPGNDVPLSPRDVTGIPRGFNGILITQS
jgi:hypothetical protein